MKLTRSIMPKIFIGGYLAAFMVIISKWDYTLLISVIVAQIICYFLMNYIEKKIY
ncbi:MAG: hypothetical protein Q8934_09055 [Bacillota bacterium]|nr:hypothetical protein [Bacillota bacterium]